MNEYNEIHSPLKTEHIQLDIYSMSTESTPVALCCVLFFLQSLYSEQEKIACFSCPVKSDLRDCIHTKWKEKTLSDCFLSQLFFSQAEICCYGNTVSYIKYRPLLYM